jgi:FtsZ-binding cell division protein ZapB
MTQLDIGLLVIDKGTQARDTIDLDAVDRYAEDMDNGAKFPPVYAIFDGLNYYLADGFHRYHATRKLKRETIDVEIENGTLEDAVLYSWTANFDHGLPRNNATKRKVVLAALAHPKTKEWTDEAIAKWCHVSRPFVSKMRGDEKPENVTFTRTNGTEVTRAARNKKSKPEDTVKKEIIGAMPPEIKADPVYDPAKDAMNEIMQENEQLKDRLAVGVMDGSEEEKTLAAETLAELREEVRKLQIINTSLVISRDQFQNENAQLKKQVAVLQRKLKQYE